MKNSIQVFFTFLNPKKVETLLMGRFTFLDIDSLDDYEILSKSLKFEISSGELKIGNKSNEIILTGFEYDLYGNDLYMKEVKENTIAKESIKIKPISEEQTNIKVEDNESKLLNNDLNQKGAAKVISIEIENNIKTCKDNIEKEKNKIIQINKIRNELKETKDKINVSNNKKLSANKGNNNYKKLSQIIITPTITPNKDITRIVNIENNIKNEISDNLTNIEKNKAKDVNKMSYINEINNENKLEDIIIPNELSNDINVTNSLRKNLFQEKVGKYFESQKLKYSKIYKNDKDLNTAIINLSIKGLKFKFHSKEMKYHNIRKALHEIIDIFSNSNNILKPDYGFFVCNKKILFYSPENSNQESEILYNLNYLRQMDYDYAAKKESSIKANTNDKDPNKVDYFLIKGLDFEKNWEFFFDYSFNMKKLPNIFFPVKTFLDYKIHIKKKSERGGFNKVNDTKSNQLDNKELNISDNNKSLVETKVEITFQEYIKKNFQYIY